MAVHLTSWPVTTAAVARLRRSLAALAETVKWQIGMQLELRRLSRDGTNRLKAAKLLAKAIKIHPKNSVSDQCARRQMGVAMEAVRAVDGPKVFLDSFRAYAARTKPKDPS